jgi:hypothetical protein
MAEGAMAIEPLPERTSDGSLRNTRPTSFLTSLYASSSTNNNGTTDTTSTPAQLQNKKLPVLGPHTVRHTDKKSWQIPDAKSQITIIGDSNLSRATQILSDARSIECHSYPGAKIVALTKMITSRPKVTSEVIILSVGINNRENQTSTHKTQVRSLVSACNKSFPNAQVYIPQINIPPKIASKHKGSLQALNEIIRDVTQSNPNVHTLPPLSNDDFKIDPRDTQYKIHWTGDTANSMIKHWINQLNHLN